MVGAAPSCSVLDIDARIVPRADICSNVRQHRTENIHIREGRLGVGGARRDEPYARESESERPTVLERNQRRNHTPDASHDSPRSRVAGEQIRVRVESTELVDESRNRACVDIERIGLTVYLKCAVGDRPGTEGILESSGVHVLDKVLVEQERGCLPGR